MTNDRYSKEWQNNQPEYKAHLLCASSIKPEPVRWLWTNYLAKGKLHILSGMAGTGKTTLALGLAAIITTAGRFPDGEICKTKGHILIWSAEDDPKDTLVPRLHAAGANTDNVHMIQGRMSQLTGKLEPFDPAIDIPLLLDEVKQIGNIELIIIDPVVSAVRGDMNKANEVRHSLQPLVDAANLLDCVVLGITHFTKGTMGRNPLERVIGSQAFGALARIVLVAAKEQDGHTRALVIAKSNIGTDNGGVNYHLEQVQLNNGIMASRVLWGEVLQGNATDILNNLEQQDKRENHEPAETLERILSEGKMFSNEIKKIMLNNGFTDKQTRSARAKLAIQITKEGFGKDIKTYWELPHKCPNSPYMPTPIYGHLCNERASMEEKLEQMTNQESKNQAIKSASSPINDNNLLEDEGVTFE